MGRYGSYSARSNQKKSARTVRNRNRLIAPRSYALTDLLQ